MKTHEYLKHSGKSALEPMTFHDFEAMQGKAPTTENAGPNPSTLGTDGTQPARSARPAAKRASAKKSRQ